MQDFARMQLKEIKENIASRRNKIFLLMEEVSSPMLALNLGRMVVSSLHLSSCFAYVDPV